MTQPIQITSPELVAPFELIDALVQATRADAATANQLADEAQSALEYEQGQNGELSLELSEAKDQIAALTTQVAALQPKPPQIGVYNGGTSGDDGVKTSFGRYPDIASTYLQGNSVTASWIKQETARIKKGISPLLSISSSSSHAAPTGVSPAAIAAQQAPAVAWLDAYLAAVQQLALVDPNVPVRVSLDQEMEVKRNQGQFAGITNAQFAAAQTYFIEQCRAGAPNVEPVVWFGGSDTASIAGIMAGINAAPDWFTLDPYKMAAHPRSETFLQSMQPKIAWLRANPDYIRLGSPKIGLSEFGVDASFGDAACASWLTGIRANLATLGVGFAVYFNRNAATYSFKLDTGSLPLSVAAFSASLVAESA